jgi:hypothetical protein
MEYKLPKRTNMEGTYIDFPKGEMYLGAFGFDFPIKEEYRTMAIRDDLGLNFLADSDMSIVGDLHVPLWKHWAEQTGRAERMRKIALFNECHNIVLLEIFWANRRVWHCPGWIILYLDERGRAIKDTHVEIAEDNLVFVPDSDDQHGILFNVSAPFLLGLSLFHCKNVKTGNAPAPGKIQRKKHRKQGQPEVKFKTLVIKPMGRRPEGDGEPTGRKHSWHICRGHFKTFTEAAPLFGRVTGTFWWGHHVRGRKSEGEVRKDYQVEPE